MWVLQRLWFRMSLSARAGECLQADEGEDESLNKMATICTAVLRDNVVDGPCKRQLTAGKEKIKKEETWWW